MLTNNRFSIPSLMTVSVASLAILFAGCGKPPVMTAENRQTFTFNVAETGIGYNLSAQQFFDLLSSDRFLLRGGTLNADEVKDILDSVVLDTLCGEVADTVTLENHRLIYRDYLHQYQDCLIKKFTDKAIFDQVTAFDSAEVLAFYRGNPSRFNVKEQVRLYQILVSGWGLLTGPDSMYYKRFSNAQLKDEARDRINTVYDLLQFGEAFENVTTAFNQDVNTRNTRGYVGWTTRGVYLDPFDSVAFRLKVGEFSVPYLDKDGWHIVYIDGHLPQGPLPIDSTGVFEYVREILLGDKRVKRSVEVSDSLRRGLRIDANDAVLDSNIYTIDDDAWCGIINGEDTVRAYVLKYYEEGFRRQYHVDSTTRDMKMEMLKVVSDRYLTVQATRRLGWDKDSDVVAFARNLRFAKSKQIVHDRQYDYNWMPTDSMLKAYYDAHLSDYVVDKPTTLQYMKVGDSAFAVFLHDQAVSGLDLSEVNRQFQATNPGGVLQVSPVMKAGAEDLPFEVWQAAVLTAPGGVSSIVKTGGNFAFVRVMERRESRNLALARGDILVKLQKQRQRRVYEQFRDTMFSLYKVRTPGRLNGVTLQPFWIRAKKS